MNGTEAKAKAKANGEGRGMGDMKGAKHAEGEEQEQLPTPSSSPSPGRESGASPPPSDSAGRSPPSEGSKSAGRSPGVQGGRYGRGDAGAEEGVLGGDAGGRNRPVLPPSVSLPLPLPPVLAIRRPGDGRRKSSVSEQERVLLRLSPKQMQELTSEEASLPLRAATPILEDVLEGRDGDAGLGIRVDGKGDGEGRRSRSRSREGRVEKEKETGTGAVKGPVGEIKQRPGLNARSVTTPPMMRRKQSSVKNQGQVHVNEEEKRGTKHVPPPLNLDHRDARDALKAPAQERHRDAPSPMPPSIPLPPMSMPTFLSLELSANRPSPLYIYRPSTADFPYESSKIKYERLVNFFKLPPKLEAVLGFGTLACLDAWLHVLTILPLRFLIAVGILIRWWISVIIKEARDILNFVYSGLPRLWRRRKHTDAPPTPVLNAPADEEPSLLPKKPPVTSPASSAPLATPSARENGHAATTFKFPDTKDAPAKRTRTRYRHRRTKSTPSALLPSHKADILKGLLVIFSCGILMRFDASRMYHGIRGQSAIKLYVIYNVLEVCDRLLSALGQDVLECLLSRETLDRNPDGRSKILRPFWMFLLALTYNVMHATALFYQVITLNVAVNSYSNALLTLLMSNQFVEIKGTVFKKFEKENLFQVTCADIVERFQLWLMLLIIAMRNIIEVGGLSIPSGAFSSFGASFGGGGGGNATGSVTFSASSILPRSFTIFPTWIGQVLNPFLLVLGSEMAVDWLKHAYITKFNQTKPEVYEKFLDVLAKDYYSDAFVDPNLTRRLGLPVLPLSCLFIRATVQTYHMFVVTYMPAPFPSSSTSLSSDTIPTSSSPTTTAALAHIDHIFRRALGRSSFGAGGSAPTSSSSSSSPWYALPSWSLDDLIAASTMLLVFLIAYCFFLAAKLLLGMALLRISRNRYRGMKERERASTETGGKRLGGFGTVDVDEEKRRWIYVDDAEGLRTLRERDERGRGKEERGFGGVARYAMVAKRIW